MVCHPEGRSRSYDLRLPQDTVATLFGLRLHGRLVYCSPCQPHLYVPQMYSILPVATQHYVIYFFIQIILFGH